MRGRVLRLSRSRRLVCDVLHFAASVPTIPVQRRMPLGTLVDARHELADRPPWPAIFARAFALVAAEIPEFRRAYCTFPWPHLYEYPTSVVAVTVERDYRDEKTVLFVRVKDPASLSLTELAARIRNGATAPVESVKDFRLALSLAGLPRPVRRLIWWVGLNAGRQRANYFGTFAVSVSSALGSESLHPLSPLTFTLNYGVIAKDGSMNVRLVYDHRVVDGVTVALGLKRLEEMLMTTVPDEVRALARLAPASVPQPTTSRSDLQMGQNGARPTAPR